MRQSLFVACVPLFLSVFLVGVPALPQSISFGVTAGVPVTDPIGGERRGFKSNFSYGFPQYLVGPDVQLRLPLRLRVEVDALYRRLFVGDTFYNDIGGYVVNSGLKLDSWEIPFLVEYKFPGKSLHPFAGGGIAYRHFGVAQYKQNYLSVGVGVTPPTLKNIYDVPNPHTVGAVVAAGIDFNLLFLRFSPQLRYSHWNESFTSGTGNTPNNQLDIVMGVNLSPFTMR
jgi:hypothetical protein